ncbi:DUF2127 domain-containing protein [Geotalea sp. SG265]|uniref:DUF2127 domain-containing protein n=1 Tax=Geotalea sp. SG265 TaxID=2922867 RepID=UPI001FAE88C0|nr:DUF2127 domain-containing protein [Geotalea sp. SG265]
MSERKHEKTGGRIHGGRAGARAVAVLEAAKGLLVILAGFGLLALIHRDVQAVAEEMVRAVHLNPASHLPRVFLDAVASVNDTKLWLLAASAMAYAVIRFIEAYGLWHQQLWAVWFGILTGCIYLPIEIYELTLSRSLLKFLMLALNIFIVLWLVVVRRQGMQSGER